MCRTRDLSLQPIFFENASNSPRTWKRGEGGYYLCFRPLESGQNPVVSLEGRELINLASNNYLGLTSHPRVVAAAKEALDRYGTGCSGSRWLNGNMLIHEELERLLADFLGKEAAIVFSTGYQTNLGAISCLVGKDDLIFTDKLDHASIIDGARMSLGRMVRFRHNDMDNLESLLKKEPSRAKLIVVDGVFSMEGDLADLPGIMDLARRYQARVFLDDAHGLGVMGPGGRGTAAHFGLTRETDLIMGTFSKSLACIGGFVAGDERPVSWIKHASRSQMFSAALPPVLTATARAAVETIIREPELVDRLWANAAQLREGLKNLGFNTGDSQTPIIPVILGNEPHILAMTLGLAQAGVFVNPVRPPAVPKGREMLRLSLMATHTPRADRPGPGNYGRGWAETWG